MLLLYKHLFTYVKMIEYYVLARTCSFCLLLWVNWTKVKKWTIWWSNWCIYCMQSFKGKFHLSIFVLRRVVTYHLQYIKRGIMGRKKSSGCFWNSTKLHFAHLAKVYVDRKRDNLSGTINLFKRTFMLYEC